jgi:hypothetical protein
MVVDQLSKSELATSSVPFGRSRFVALAGAAVFGLAEKMVRPGVARAYHGAVPPGCDGFGECHCCNESTCCESGCNYDGVSHCHTGQQCWNVCYNGNIWRCCDWHDGSGNHCICRGWVRCGCTIQCN